MTTFKSTSYRRRRMDRQTATRLREEKAAQKKIEDRSRSTDQQEDRRKIGE